MYRRCQRWMLIINNRFLSLYDYNFLLVTQRLEKIFLEKPDWKKKEKHHQSGMHSPYLSLILFYLSFLSPMVIYFSNPLFLLRHLSRFPDFSVFKRILSPFPLTDDIFWVTALKHFFSLWFLFLLISFLPFLLLTFLSFAIFFITVLGLKVYQQAGLDSRTSL